MIGKVEVTGPEKLDVGSPTSGVVPKLYEPTFTCPAIRDQRRIVRCRRSVKVDPATVSAADQPGIGGEGCVPAG